MMRQPFSLLFLILLSLFRPVLLSAEDAGSVPNAASVDDPESEEEVLENAHALVPGETVRKTGHFWRKPKYEGQSNALGYSKAVFHEPPPGLEGRVQFWVDIYTKYTTKQALLHDSKYMGIVYKVLDFNDIESDAQLDARQREKAKKKRVKEEKKHIKDQLERLQKHEDTPSQLNAEDLALLKRFRFVSEKKKFAAAARRGRLRIQLGQSDRFKLGIYYSGRFLRHMEKIFREEGLPVELTRLPFVESSFNLYARSHVGASGIWQFMRSTGRLFRLKTDAYSDQRNDPLLATRAAARLLKLNYNMLGSWPLALTGYNHGPAGVNKIKKKLKSEDINEIIWNSEARRFGFASENFFAEFLAAIEVEGNADRYFGKLETAAPIECDEVEIPASENFRQLVQSMGGDEEMVRTYNPHLSQAILRGALRLPRGYHVRLPKGSRLLPLTGQKEGVKPETPPKSPFYKVLPGDTLSSISRDSGISVQKIMSANGLEKDGLLKVGQEILIPAGEQR